MNVRVDDVETPLVEQLAKAQRKRESKRARMNLTIQAADFRVQCPVTVRQRREMKLVAAQRPLTHQVEGPQFCTAAVHSPKDVKDLTQRNLEPGRSSAGSRQGTGRAGPLPHVLVPDAQPHRSLDGRDDHERDCSAQ